MAYSADQREAAINAVVAGLQKGTPLAVICSADGMPCDDTIRSWADSDPAVSRAIARAREAGWDAIAVETLRIADTPLEGETRVEKDDGKVEVRREDMLGHRKLQVDTRLKLLAKWDPKRYGELLKLGDPDAGALTVNIRKPA